MQTTAEQQQAAEGLGRAILEFCITLRGTETPLLKDIRQLVRSTTHKAEEKDQSRRGFLRARRSPTSSSREASSSNAIDLYQDAVGGHIPQRPNTGR